VKDFFRFFSKSTSVRGGRSKAIVETLESLDNESSAMISTVSEEKVANGEAAGAKTSSRPASRRNAPPVAAAQVETSRRSFSGDRQDNNKESEPVKSQKAAQSAGNADRGKKAAADEMVKMSPAMTPRKATGKRRLASPEKKDETESPSKKSTPAATVRKVETIIFV
jgi:hypothetical protein